MNKQARIRTLASACNTLLNMGMDLVAEGNDAKQQELIRQIGDLCLRTGEACRQHLMDWEISDE